MNPPNVEELREQLETLRVKQRKAAENLEIAKDRVAHRESAYVEAVNEVAKADYRLRQAISLAASAAPQVEDASYETLGVVYLPVYLNGQELPRKLVVPVSALLAAVQGDAARDLVQVTL